MQRVPVWLDCDPGHDDAMAIILAAHHEALNLIGISTVSGNQSVDKTTRNAAKIAAVCGIKPGSIPVVRGADRPLVASIRHDAEIHGESGMDGSDALNRFTHPPYTTDGEKAVLAMARTITSHPEKVSLVATGALTNVALLLRLFPETLNNISQIVLMGGAIGVGNRSPVAEFNILCDPEAASIVFDAPVKTVMVPLEVTHTALVTNSVLDRIDRDLHSSTLSRVVREIMTFFAHTYSKTFGFDHPPLHDPLAVAYVINPSIFTTKHLRVDVVPTGHICAGQTVCDVWRYSSSPPNVHVATKADIPQFWEMMYTALRRCNAVTPLNSKL